MLLRAIELRTISDKELVHVQSLMGAAEEGDMCLLRADATETTNYILLQYTHGKLERLSTVQHEGVHMFLRFHFCIKKFGTFDEGHYRLARQHPIAH